MKNDGKNMRKFFAIGKLRGKTGIAVAAALAGITAPSLAYYYTKFNTSGSVSDTEKSSPNLNLIASSSQQTATEPPGLRVKYKSASNGSSTISLNDAILICENLVTRKREEVGAPGGVVGVSVNGHVLWQDGFGHSDVENGTSCHSKTVMRIASISKPITMACVAKLWQDGKLDMHKPINEYLPKFPKKTVDGESVSITCHQLASHLAGIRHYEKKKGKKHTCQDEDNNNTKDSSGSTVKLQHDRDTKHCKNTEQKTHGLAEFEQKEYFLKKKFENVQDAVALFENDELFAKPGESFLYSTHGYTLLSRVVETITKKDFQTIAKELFKTFAMEDTYLDENNHLIYNRSRYYIRNKKGFLENAPYVDNSYKWAGGGFLSTIPDLLRFGNAMLYAAQYETYQEMIWKNFQDNPQQLTAPSACSSLHVAEEKSDMSQMTGIYCPACSTVFKPGYLNSATMTSVWSPVDKTLPVPSDEDIKYSLGWSVSKRKQNFGGCEEVREYACHTGGAIGASSVLLLLPKTEAAAESSLSAGMDKMVATVNHEICGHHGQTTQVESDVTNNQQKAVEEKSSIHKEKSMETQDDYYGYHSSQDPSYPRQFNDYNYQLYSQPELHNHQDQQRSQQWLQQDNEHALDHQQMQQQMQQQCAHNICNSCKNAPPQGIAVAIMVNLQGVPLQRLALEIAHVFENVPF